MTGPPERPDSPDRSGAPSDGIVIRRRDLVLPLAASVGVAVLLGTDLVLDRAEGADLLHLATEAVAMVAALVGAAVLVHAWRQEQQQRAAAQAARAQAVAEARQWQAEATRWREEAHDALAGLSRALDTQFDRWELTPAEAEVALLLLKGLSFKEIAAVRDVSERTARSQARAVYAKAGLSGRAELSAFFLEDLLLPRG